MANTITKRDINKISTLPLIQGIFKSGTTNENIIILICIIYIERKPVFYETPRIPYASLFAPNQVRYYAYLFDFTSFLISCTYLTIYQFSLLLSIYVKHLLCSLIYI